MKLQQVQELLSAKILCGGDKLENEVNSACGCDLMSDVLAFVKDRALLLSGLVNPQVIRTAEMMDISAIVFVRGKMPDEATLKLADDKDMVIFSTELPLYVSCGRLYSNGLTNEQNTSDVKKEG